MTSSFWLKSAAVGSLFLFPALVHAATAGFSAPSWSVKEGETASIKVKLSGARSGETTVRVLVYPGTAWRGTYAPSGVQKLSFPVGTTEQSFDIRTFKTGRAKNQTVGLRLISVSGTGNSVDRGARSGVLVIRKGTVATSTPPGGGTVPASCTTSATYTGNFTVDAQKQVFSLKPGETGAMSFKTNSTARITLSSTDTVLTPSDADHELRLSACPGDFSNPSVTCGGIVQMTGGSVIAAVDAQPWDCKVDANKTYYINVRHRRLTSPTENSCSSSDGCEVRLQISNYRP